MNFFMETGKMSILTEDQWIADYRPLPAPRPGSGFDYGDGCTLIDGTQPMDIAHLEQAGNNRVWTVVDDGENTAIVPGQAHVNRLGYIVTQNPWDDTVDEVVIED
jgi:hypothetical protein